MFNGVDPSRAVRDRVKLQMLVGHEFTPPNPRKAVRLGRERSSRLLPASQAGNRVHHAIPMWLASTVDSLNPNGVFTARKSKLIGSAGKAARVPEFESEPFVSDFGDRLTCSASIPFPKGVELMRRSGSAHYHRTPEPPLVGTHDGERPIGYGPLVSA